MTGGLKLYYFLSIRFQDSGTVFGREVDAGMINSSVVSNYIRNFKTGMKQIVHFACCKFYSKLWCDD